VSAEVKAKKKEERKKVANDLCLQLIFTNSKKQCRRKAKKKYLI
jgi:hypothetical protein